MPNMSAKKAEKQLPTVSGFPLKKYNILEIIRGLTKGRSEIDITDFEITESDK